MQAKKAKQTAVLGKTTDGIVIYEPEFDPVEVSRAKIRLAVKAVKRRHMVASKGRLAGVGKTGTAETARASGYSSASTASTD